MYCPHCGRVLSVIDGWYTCSASGMQLSKWLEEKLTDRFPEQFPRKEPVVLGRSLTRWYCPGCGVPLDREMKCGSCGKAIHDLLFPLVELHPHSDG
jgi:hypothetical protein